MTALNDAERAVDEWATEPSEREVQMPLNTALGPARRYYPAWLPSRRFFAAVTAIGGMQLMATMDGTIAIVALPRIQNELSLSDAGRSWVITAYVLTFGGLMLLGGRLGDTIGRKRTFIVGVALFTIASALCGIAWDEAPLVTLLLAPPTLRETPRERMKLDAAGAVLATLICTAAVFAFSMGPEKGWISVTTIGSGVVGLVAFIAFAVVERTAENPVVPFDLFFDRNRLATFAAIFMAGGVLFTVTVLVAIYVQDIMGYSALRAGVGFIPFAIAMGIGLGGSSQLVSRFQPRVVVIAGGALVVGAMIYGSTFNGRMPYFPNLIVPVVIAGIGIGMIVLPVGLCAIPGVGFDQIGPTSAIALMLQNLGGPVVLAVIQAVITSRTLYLGGTNGPVKNMNAAQLNALDHGYTYGLLWVAGVAVIVGGVSLLIGYTAEQVAHAQEVKDAIDAGEL